MTQYKVTDSQLSSIANAIRTKGSTSAPLSFPDGFISAVNNIPTGGGANLGSLEVSVNGEYTPTGGLDGFDNVIVSVPQSGITPTGSISISQNGTYDVSSFAEAVVSVSGGGGTVHGFVEFSGVTFFDASGITSIPSFGFSNTVALKTVSLDLCEYVGEQAFSSCSNLSEVFMPMLKQIKASGFRQTGLENISFPLCMSLSNDAFWSCSKLTNVYLPNLLSIDGNAFARCVKLSSIDLPELLYMSGSGADYGTFFSCVLLSSVSIPKCSQLGAYDFQKCSLLREISLPACGIIGNGVFRSCTALESVYIGYSSVATLKHINAFASTPMSLSSYLGYFGSIYVPASLVNEYKAASNWSVYSDRITAINE